MAEIALEARMKFIPGQGQRRSWVVPCSGCGTTLLVPVVRNIKGGGSQTEHDLNHKAITRQLHEHDWTWKPGFKRARCPECRAVDDAERAKSDPKVVRIVDHLAAANALFSITQSAETEERRVLEDLTPPPPAPEAEADEVGVWMTIEEMRSHFDLHGKHIQGVYLSAWRRGRRQRVGDTLEVLVVESKDRATADKIKDRLSKGESEMNVPVARPSEPRQPTVSQRRAIRDALDESYDEDARRYRKDGSDEKLATKLNVPRAWVTEIRSMFYGEHDRNEVAEAAALLVTTFGDRIKALEEKIWKSLSEHEGEIKKLKAELDTAQSALRK